MSHVFRVLSYGDELDEGDSVPTYCTLGAIAKRSGRDLPMLVVNELVAFRIGLLLGLPVIPGVALSDGIGPASYLSLRFGPESEQPPPIIPSELVQDDRFSASGAVVFDCLIANADRHVKNAAYQRDRIRFSLFDHDRALFGKTGLERLRGTKGSHCLETNCIAQELTDGSDFSSWTERVRDLKSYQLRTIIETSADDAAVSLLVDDAVEILCARRDRVGAMLQEAFDARVFPKMQQRFM